MREIKRFFAFLSFLDMIMGDVSYADKVAGSCALRFGAFVCINLFHEAISCRFRGLIFAFIVKAHSRAYERAVKIIYLRLILDFFAFFSILRICSDCLGNAIMGNTSYVFFVICRFCIFLSSICINLGYRIVVTGVACLHRVFSEERNLRAEYVSFKVKMVDLLGKFLASLFSFNIVIGNARYIL